jgi:hypothetical protein
MNISSLSLNDVISYFLKRKRYTSDFIRLDSLKKRTRRSLTGLRSPLLYLKPTHELNEIRKEARFFLLFLADKR